MILRLSIVTITFAALFAVVDVKPTVPDTGSEGCFHCSARSGNLNLEMMQWNNLSTADIGGLKSFPYFFTHLAQIFDFRKFFNYVEAGVSSKALCLACKTGVFILDKYISDGATEDDIASLSRKICSFFHIETARVCAGLSELFKRQITQVLAKVAFTPTEICGLMLGSSCANAVNPLHNWTVVFPPYPKPPVRPIPEPKHSAPVLKVLHLSDVHIDMYYQEGSLANCKEPLCCRSTSGVPSKASDAAGYWGDYRNCDTPFQLLDNMLDHISRTHKIDYVIWTGDIPAHDIWNTSRSEVTYLIQETSRLMKKYFPHVPIFPAVGNHESSPVDSFPIPQIKGNDSISWLYNELANTWSPWLGSDVVETLKIGAYYTVLVYPGFRIISVNMNYCNNLNWWLLINSTDPTDELQWMVRQLQLAEIKGEKVHIIGHIPPGNGDCLRVWSHNYHRIIERYEGTVRGQFFGHTHSDEFAVFYDTEKYSPKSRPLGVAYIGPSVTSYNGYNPGYRIYSVDGNYENSSRVVLDHETYIMNLTDANATKKPYWKLEYTARKAYNMTSLLYSDWNNLVNTFEKNDNLFQKFYRFHVKDSDHYAQPCDESCKSVLLCRLRKGCSNHFCLPSN